MKKYYLLFSLLCTTAMCWADPTVNIAEGKTAVSGWPMSGNEVPSKAVDGNHNTHWISWQSTADKAWWGVDLGNAYRLHSFTIVWENEGRMSSHFLIQIATGNDAPSDFVDNASYSTTGWVTIAEINEAQSSDASGNSYDLGPVTARYVRFVTLTNVTQTSISEFKLYADASASDPIITPTISTASLQSDLSEGSATLTLTATDHSGNPLHTFLLQDQMGKYYRVMTDESDHATLTGLGNKRYTFTVWAIEEGCLSESSRSLIVGEDTFNPSANLALNKPAYAYKYRSGCEPYRVVDNNLGNHWNAGGDNNAETISEEDRDHVWWYVDLQDQYELKYISLYWTEAYATSFIMQVCKNEPAYADADDDRKWETFLDYSGTPTRGDQEANGNLYGDVEGASAAFALTPKGRYIRFRAKDANNWAWGVQIRELRVYGNGYLALDNEAPIISEASYNGLTADLTGVKFNVAATDDQTDPVTEYEVVDHLGTPHLATASTGIITVTDMPTGKNVDVTIYAFDAAGNRSEGEEVTITYLRPDENLALNKTTFACVNINEGEGHAKAVDGNINTDWTSWSHGNHANDWWYVDLGDFYDIRRVEVVWTDERHSTDFSIQYRQAAPEGNSGATEAEWNNIAEFTNKSGNQEIDITNTQAQFICLRSKECFSNNPSQVRLKELRVFGKAFAEMDLTAPVITTAEVAEDSENYTSVKLHLVASDNKDASVKHFFLNKGDDNWLPIETDAFDYYTVSDLARGHYSYQVKATDNAENISEISTVNFTIFNPADNLALNQPVVTGYTPGDANEVPAKANDGDLNKAWTTYTDQPMDMQWWSVDLGNVYQLSDIDLFWTANDNAYSNHYMVQVAHTAPTDRSDDTQWYTALEVNETQHLGTTEEDKNRYAIDAAARYVRFKAIEKEGTFLRLRELRVFGSSYASEDTHAPEITTASASYNNDGKAYLTLIASDVEDGAIKQFRVTNTTLGTTQMMTTDANNQLVYDDLEQETSYHFEIQAMDKAAHLSAVSEVHVYIPVPTTTNIAIGQTTRAGYVNLGNDSEHPEAAVDDDENTSWTTYDCSTPEDRWWEVELDGMYHLTKIAVLWNDEYYARKYTIMTRVYETEDWTVQPQVTIDAHGLKEMDLDVNAAYVRIVIDEQAGGWVRMHEVRLFADAKAIVLKEDDNASILTTYDDVNTDIVLSRNILADGTWYTLCLPFDMSAEKVNEVFGASTIAELASAEDHGSLISLKFDYVHAIEAGKAYLIKAGNNLTAGTVIPNVQIKNVDPIVSVAKDGETDLMHFQGTYNKTTLRDSNIRFVAADDYLYSPNSTKGTVMGAFRCYFTIPEGSSANAPGKRARIVMGEQTATGVQNVQSHQVSYKKMLRDGQLLIIREGRMYNAQGMIVSE